MTTVRLALCPEFSTVRSVTGAVAADSATLSDANFPPANCIVVPPRVLEIVAYWDATGAGVHDFADLEVLIRDDKAVVPKWTSGQRVQGLNPRAVGRFRIDGASHVYLRVANVVCAAGTDLLVRAAFVPLG